MNLGNELFESADFCTGDLQLRGLPLRKRLHVILDGLDFELESVELFLQPTSRCHHWKKRLGRSARAGLREELVLGPLGFGGGGSLAADGQQPLVQLRGLREDALRAVALLWGALRRRLGRRAGRRHARRHERLRLRHRPEFLVLGVENAEHLLFALGPEIFYTILETKILWFMMEKGGTKCRRRRACGRRRRRRRRPCPWRRSS